MQPVTLLVTLHFVIRRILHKGLQRFFETGSKSGIQAQHADRLRLILAQRNAATRPEDMALPGLVLHPLKGDRKGQWSVRVSGNCASLLFLQEPTPIWSTTRTITERLHHAHA